MAERPPPRFTGVSTYQDPLGRFSLRFPTDWNRFAVEGRDGVQAAPTFDDPETSFTAWVTPLEVPVVAEDLDELKRGVTEGLAQLDGCAIAAEDDVVLGNLIRFERVFTFRENGATRKRKSWLVYVDTWLISLTWQGSSPEEYEYWLSMANYAFNTFNLPPGLWFAVDRDLAGKSRDEPS